MALAFSSRFSIALASVLFGSAVASAAEVDYTRDVKPILAQHCYRCHGPLQQKGGMRADTVAFLREGGDVGSALEGEGEKNVLLQVLLGTHDEITQMPYKKPPLSEAQIGTVRAWVKQGAKGPENEEPAQFDHWAFVPPKRPEAPMVQRKEWPRNAIDAFILERLESEKIAPSPEADRTTLLRRVSLDLTGLPPTPAETAAFVNDKDPKAYERAVERLLASPHYGERWARPWLDAARYGDSNGYSIDAPRQIWKYRDWVVNAFNQDLPFDQFVIDQLAGDLLPNSTVEQRIATGFNRNTQINQEGGIDPEQFRIEGVMDRVNTFGTVFLGLTIGCAQCHDHKFDPIKQSEYYQLFAFFNSTLDDGHGDNRIGGRLFFKDDGTADVALANDTRAANDAVRAYLMANAAGIEEWRKALPAEERAKQRSSSTRSALDVPWDKQTFNQRRAVFAVARPDDAEFKKLNGAYMEFDRREARATSTLVMQELPQPRESHLFIKGDFTRLGDKVTPGTPAVLPALKVEKPNRLDLAKWVVDPAQPLTARVMVNRIWQQYFGHGLVDTENDFGTQGSLPTHPALLDWLATEFIRQKWSMKAIHRLIVTSATYRQASRVRPELAVSDPINKLLARQERLRLDAEIVRDVSLAASGLLAPKLGGPPVYPPQPEGVMNLGQVKRAWVPSKGEDRYRRGLYTHIWRATPHPAFAVFDAADGFSACTRRLRSNTPLQALTLLNDQQFYEFAVALAERIQKEATGDLATQIDYAFRLCLSRSPKPKESERLIALYQQTFAAVAGDDTAKRNEAWTTVARVLLNLDETITRE